MTQPDDLSPVETALRHGPDVTASDAPRARDRDAFAGHDWSVATVRPERVRDWLLAASGGGGGARSALRLRGARITGELDLRGLRVDRTVELSRCRFDGPLLVSDAEFRHLLLSGSRLPRLDAEGLSCDILLVDDGAVVELDDPDAAAVNLSSGQFGRADFGGALVSNPRGIAIDGNVLTSTRSVNLNRGFVAVGRVRFIGASIGGQLNLRRSLFDRGENDKLLSLHEATIARAVYLRDSIFLGPVNFSAAKANGRVDAKSSFFVAPGERSLYLDGTTVERAIQLNRSVSYGTIQAQGVKAGGVLDLANAILLAGGHTPALDRLRRIGLETPWEERIKAITAVRRSVEAAVRTPAPGGPRDVLALDVQRATLGTNVDLTSTVARGGLRVTASDVGRSVVVDDARVTGEPALDLSDSRIATSLVLRSPGGLDGTVRLRHAAVGHLADTYPTWPEDRTDLTGLRYDSLDVYENGWTVDTRLRWLDGQAAFATQPYSHLANLLTAAGRSEDARKVLHRRERQRRRRGGMRWWRRLVSLASGGVAGHGYRPEYALYWLVAVVLAGWYGYGQAWKDGAVRETRDRNAAPARCVKEGPCFNPIAVSVDRVLPVLDLGYEDTWTVRNRPGRWNYEATEVGLTALGWLFGTAGVAGLTVRIVRA